MSDSLRILAIFLLVLGNAVFVAAEYALVTARRTRLEPEADLGSRSARAALDLNPGDRNIAERAVKALSVAGDLARRRMESRAAADLYERALALAGPEDRWTDVETWILSMLGEYVVRTLNAVSALSSYHVSDRVSS